MSKPFNYKKYNRVFSGDINPNNNVMICDVLLCPECSKDIAKCEHTEDMIAKGVIFKKNGRICLHYGNYQREVIRKEVCHAQ